MNEEYLTTKIKHISESALAQAIQETANIGEREALKLARMYFRFNDQEGEETLKEVLHNLEINADIEVLKRSQS